MEYANLLKTTVMKKLLLLLTMLVMGVILFAQTPGVIIKNAGTGAAILDPDGDGYISAKTNGKQIGFSGTPNNDFSHSEIPFIPLVKEDESNDVIQGSGCKFTELVGDSANKEYAALVYFDGTNLLFRIRIADISNSSKGYSILIDTDQKFGSTGINSDPNALNENKGFEVEVSMITKKSVSVYNVDGSITPELIIENSYDNFAQKSVAGSSFCNQKNYFYDFYIPFYQLTSIPGLNITTSSPLRFAVVTNIAPGPSIGSLSIADIGGCSSIQTFDSQATEVINKRSGIVIGDLGGSDDSSTCAPISDVCLTDTTIWLGSINNDWGENNNWSNEQPTKCSHIIIPALTEDIFYPIITCPTSCASITFLPDAGILGLELLKYDKAYVQADLERSTWRIITPPLKEMYAGDYYFQGSPITYLNYFSQINLDALYYPGKNTGIWNTKISEQNTALENGQGYYNYIATKIFHYPNPITYETDNLIVEFPKTNLDESLINIVYPYNSSTGMLNYSSPIELYKDTATAYRFLMENDANELINGKIAINQGLNLLGNPYMSHIDFDALYISNLNKIANKIKYWNGTTFSTYIAGSGISSNYEIPGHSIAPMQGFFVEGLLTDSIEIDILTNFTINRGFSKKNDSANILYIVSENGIKKSSTAIAYRVNANNNLDEQDAFKLFSQYTDVPEIYSVVEEVNLDINQFNSLPYIAPLGLNSGMPGEVLLTFNGANNFDNIDVFLLNISTGIQQDLKINNQYTLDYEANSATDGFLFVEFRAKDVPTSFEEKEYCENCIQVYQKDGNTIGIISRPDDKINNITIWEQSGIMLYNSNKVDRSELEVNINVINKTCVVRVATEKNSYVVKLLMQE